MLASESTRDLSSPGVQTIADVQLLALGHIEQTLREVLATQTAQLEVQTAHLRAFQAHTSEPPPENAGHLLADDHMVEQPAPTKCVPAAGDLSSPQPCTEPDAAQLQPVSSASTVDRPPVDPVATRGLTREVLDLNCDEGAVRTAQSSESLRWPSLRDETVDDLQAVEERSKSLGLGASCVPKISQGLGGVLPSSQTCQHQLHKSFVDQLGVMTAWRSLQHAVWETQDRTEGDVQEQLLRMPRSVQRLMRLTGVMPCPQDSSAAKAGRLYSLYNYYLQYACWGIAMFWTAHWTALTYWSTEHDFADYMFPFLLCGFVVVSLPWLIIWKREFGFGGQTLALLSNLGPENIKWPELQIAFCTFVVCVALIGALLLAKCGLKYRRHYEVSEIDEWRAWWVIPLLDVVGLPAALVWLANVYGLAWLSIFAGKLHRFDLRKYSRTLAAAVEATGTHDDILHVLKKYEATVTRRLRLASRAWVRYEVLIVALNSGVGLCVCMAVFLQESVDIFGAAVLFLGILSSNVQVCYSLTLVADTFEYDVLKDLNNPVVMNRVQKYMGQQFLHHIKTLDWGFRFGGTVLNTRLAMQLTVPLAVGILSALFKLLLDNTDILSSPI